MNFLIGLVALYGSLNTADLAPPSNISQLKAVRLFSPENALPNLVMHSLQFSPVGALSVQRSLSLSFHDAFTGGAGVSGSLQPVRWLRLQGGLMENSVHPGAEVGLTLMPFDLWLLPSISVEAGHYWPSDAGSTLRALTANSKLDCSLLQNFSYDFQSTHLGVDVAVGPVALSLKGGFMQAEMSTLNVARVLEVSALNPAVPTLQAKRIVAGPSAKLVLTFRL